ncbi:MAG: hypothetical protein ACLUGO_06125 [Mediterraneibacter faecis]
MYIAGIPQHLVIPAATEARYYEGGGCLRPVQLAEMEKALLAPCTVTVV